MQCDGVYFGPVWRAARLVRAWVLFERRKGREFGGLTPHSTLCNKYMPERLRHRATCTGSTQWASPVVLTAAEHRCSNIRVGGAHASPRRSHTLRHHHFSSWAARDVRSFTTELAGSSSTIAMAAACRLGAVTAATVGHGSGRTATAM